MARVASGALLCFLAVRLAGRNRRLLTNQALPEDVLDRLRGRLAGEPGVAAVARLEAVYLGPGDVLAAAEVQLEDGLSAAEVALTLARARERVQGDVPAITRLYLTPVE